MSIERKSESQQITERLNREIPANTDRAVYSILMDRIREKVYDIYDAYDRGDSNPLLRHAATREEFFELVESRKEDIFGNLQFAIRNIINKAASRKLDAGTLEKFFSDIDRETWNLVYRGFVQKKAVVV